MERKRVCLAHLSDAAVAVCASCDRAMCASCWTHTAAGRPTCEACVELLRQPVPPLVAIGTAVLGVGAAVALGWSIPLHPVLRGAIAVAVGIGSLWGAARFESRANERRRAVVVEKRPPVPIDHLARVGHPYRGVILQIGRRLTPPLSAAMAVFVVAAALAITAGVVPKLVHARPWIEAETVVLAWWAIWAATLSLLLYRGWRMAGARNLTQARPSAPAGSRAAWPVGFDLSGCVDLPGGSVVVSIVCGLMLGWVLAELVAVPLALGCYVLILGAMRRVARDRHDCERRLVRSVAWGALWATVYTLPLALLVWLAHGVASRAAA